MSARALFVSIAASAAVALLGACSGGDAGDESTPTATVAVQSAMSSTPAETASSTPSSAPATSATPQPDASSSPSQSGAAAFCAQEVDGVAGFVRSEQCSTGQSGFVLDLGPELGAVLSRGRFVQSCLQPAGDAGFRVSVGRLCVTMGADGKFIVTEDPRPPELADVLSDGALIPRCRIGPGPARAVEVGPPCIREGTGPAFILADPVPLERAANCTAGLAYMFELVEPFEQLIATLDRVLALHAVGDRVEAAAVLRAELEQRASAGLDPEPTERAALFFESWGTRSPVMMRQAVVRRLSGLLTALEGDAAAGDVTSLGLEARDEVEDGVFWFTAGRDC